MEEVNAQLGFVEDSLDRRLGDSARPLLVSVRSGAKFSMPGMMDTILSLGLNDETVVGCPHRQSLCLGQLPPLHPDVFQRRAGHLQALLRAYPR